MAWATSSDVATRLTSYVTITTNTPPTTAQVTQWIADHEAELKGAMSEGGWSLTQTDADALAYLLDLVVTGVAGQLLQTRMRSIGAATKVDDLGKSYRARWDAQLESIRKGRNAIPGGAKVTGGPPSTPRPGVVSVFLDTDTIPDERGIGVDSSSFRW